ncbi:LysM peptidoglycan-binding domain-containing protein [Staphylococcus ratti]|uniref:LysM peptidoglycan-binding domain-containing protein n=1 Tax=Staphylococcus ratti TaxID=2892440 RepID=A0ABY3PEF4_9STAP|nr:LysM domain-containing protein [Staphylococcus ratti]UEX90699.1 LysM peptidoglycan-binding domain-containing protein [Staphylococcus ratti]
MKKLLLATSTVGLLAAAQFATNAEAAHQEHTQVQEGVHFIQWGDTLNKISKKYDVTVQQLKDWNNLKSDLIIAGEKLYVTEAAAAAHSATSTQNFVLPTSSSFGSFETATYNQSTSYSAPVNYTTSGSYETYTAPATQYVTPSYSHVQTQPTSHYQAPSTAAGSGSVYQQFINAGGTPAMWNSIVLPESGGNPNIVSPTGYRGLGQTKEAWGTGSVATQTQGMINYANSRYGSVERAVQFRLANGWW